MKTVIDKTKFFCTCIFVCVLCVDSVWAEEKSPPPDPYADAQTLVEAFVVKVSTATLKEMGVDPLGQGSNETSILKLAACLQKDTAHVISGAKVAVKQSKEGVTRDEKCIHLKEVNAVMIPNPGNSAGTPFESLNIQYRDYNFGKTLEVSAKILSETAILTEYDYQEHGYLIDPKNYDPNNAPPADSYTYSWNGVLSICPGKPVIAGGSQNKDSVVFLVLTATAQNLSEIKQEKSVMSSASEQNP
jgi:hypothetical protein